MIALQDAATWRATLKRIIESEACGVSNKLVIPNMRQASLCIFQVWPCRLATAIMSKIWRSKLATKSLWIDLGITRDLTMYSPVALVCGGAQGPVRGDAELHDQALAVLPITRGGALRNAAQPESPYLPLKRHCRNTAKAQPVLRQKQVLIRCT